jgi:hypothetical protein
MSSRLDRFFRNPITFLVSLLLALVAVVGTSAAERAPHRQQRQSAAVGHAAPVRHDTAFRAVPGTKLQIRAVQYDGSTNGSLVVQVKNPGKITQKFSATGLYFVPEGDPNTAPQRLGAVGPMQLASAAQGKEIGELEIAAGATVEVVLDVFCIDSHRSSPSPQNRFSIGASRLPKQLAATIERQAESAVDEERAEGAPAPRPAAKGKIQSEVWKSRDAKWVELDGEGKQEATKKK